MLEMLEAPKLFGFTQKCQLIASLHAEAVYRFGVCFLRFAASIAACLKVTTTSNSLFSTILFTFVSIYLRGIPCARALFQVIWCF